MRELLVMRHAKSDWDAGVSDFNRPLNQRGTAAAAQMAEWIKDEGLTPDRILSSAAVRTRTTAQQVADTCGVPGEHVVFSEDFYLASGATWLEAIRGLTDDRVMLCGHNPGMDVIVDFLASRSAPETISHKLMTTAAVAYFRFECEWSEVDRETGELVTLARPKEL